MKTVIFLEKIILIVQTSIKEEKSGKVPLTMTHQTRKTGF